MPGAVRLWLVMIFLLWVLLAQIAWLVGSIPFALVFARLFGLPDPRTYGSQNPGATNVMRTGNKLAAFCTLVADVGKCYLMVLLVQKLPLFLPNLAGSFWLPWIVATVAVCGLLGHVFPVFLKFRGGRGVASAGGILLALNPLLGALVVGIWLSSLAITRVSGHAASISTLCAPVLSWFFLRDTPVYVAAVIMISLIVLWRHRSHIRAFFCHSGKEKDSVSS